MSAANSPTRTATEIFNAAWSRGWTLEKELTISEWADMHRKLSRNASSEPGDWRTSRFPFTQEIMDNLGPQSPVQIIVYMKSAQVAGSETGYNWIGYTAHHNPGPMMFVMPTLDTMKKVVRQRINPMIEDTPALATMIAEARSRDTANTTLIKEFPGGVLIMSGANSAASLRSMPIRDLFMDEVDEYKPDVEGQGDPVELAVTRTQNFPKKKIFLCSTPTIHGASRIETEFLMTDQRRYFVPCPLCGHMQHLRWKDPDGTYRIVWDRDENGEHMPETARYKCEACDGEIPERHKTKMLAAGEWRATARSTDPKMIGYHINGLYSPLGFLSWQEVVKKFLKAKGNKERMKTWVNTVLGETWKEENDGIDANFLASRTEPATPGVVPNEAAVLVAAVDVQAGQGARLEAKIIAYGPGEESWLVDYQIFWGDPSAPDPLKPNPWLELDEWRQREWQRADGRKMKIAIMLIDSGDGNQNAAVYDYVRPRQGFRVYASKGQDHLSRPGLAMPSTSKNLRVQLWNIATVAAKDRVFSRMAIQKPGPGYMHMPEWAPDTYFDQMTSEKRVIEFNKTTKARKVVYVQNGANEALDLEVYCLAGLFVLQNYIAPHVYRDLGKLRDAIAAGTPVVQPARRRVRSSGIT